MMSTILIAAILTAARLAAFRWEDRPYTALNCGLVVLFALLAAFASQTIYRGWRQAHRSRLTRWSLVVWWSACILALLFAPHTSDPERFPIATWLGLLSIGGAAMVESNTASERLRLSVLRVLAALWLLVAAAATVQYFTAIRPHIGGVDFFYYLTYSRDMLQDSAQVPPGAYSYFPGVYQFWRTAMQMVGSDLASLQVVHLCVVVLVGVAIAFTVYQLTDNYWLTFASPFLYWMWASRFEAFTGVTEPLATLFFVLGLIAFGGEPLRGRAGWQRATFCGLAWGLSVYCKQQAGLLTAGYSILLLGKLRYPNHDKWPQLLAIPCVACVTLVAGILWEGRQWQPLLQGITTAVEYAPQGTWFSNVYVQLRHDESAALAALVSGIALLFISIKHAEHREWLAWLRVVQVAVLGALLGFLQFQRRAYGHYMLLAVPSLVLAYVIVGWHVSLVVFRRSRFDPLVAWMMIGVGLFPFFYTGANAANLHVWQIRPPQLGQLRLWHERPEVRADLKRLARRFEASQQRILVLPRYRNDVYFIAQLRGVPALGYGFQLPPAEQFPWNDVEAIVVVRQQFDTHPERDRYEQEMKPIIDAIDDQGFAEVLRLPSLHVYERP